MSALALACACAPPPTPWWRRAPLDEPVASPDKHFVIGNETRHDLFAPLLADRGGAFLGVGGDQCYTLLALADAQRAYLVDHDPEVVAWHHRLGAGIVAAADPPALLAGLDPSPAVARHLERVAARPGTWLSEPVLYARVRALWRAGAVHPVVGDLAGARAMPSIAVAACSHALEFTTVYLSNAEETMTDRRALLRNLAMLPHSRDSVVLRTFFVEPIPAADGLWSYQSHALADLLARAAAPGAPTTIAALIADAEARGRLTVDAGEPGLSAIAP